MTGMWVLTVRVGDVLQFSHLQRRVVRGIIGRVELLMMSIVMHLRRIGLLHELRECVRVVQGHLKSIVSSVRKRWRNDVRRRGRDQIDILVRGHRLGSGLSPVSTTKRKVSTTTSPIGIDTSAPKLRIVHVSGTSEVTLKVASSWGSGLGDIRIGSTPC